MESKNLLSLFVFALLGLFCETQGASYSNFTSNYLTTHNSRRGSKDIRIPESYEQRSFRNSKLFPLFTVIRFTNEVCRTNNDETGVCYTRTQCNSLGGLAQGSCASGLGVCCRFIATCGAIVYQNGTSFQNPNYPSKYVPVGGSDVCQIRIRKQNNVCQLKLHFHVFEVEGPISPSGTGNQQNTEAGVCKTDSLAITSSGASIPSICGTMNDQHLYIDFGSSDTITLNLLLGGATQRERTWNIEILTIPCNSASRAPTGCLQYFTGVSGTVESFNFQGGLHLANLDYSICMRMEDGMRFIDWMPCATNSVRFGNGPATLPTTPPTQNTACQPNIPDYLVIAQGISFPVQAAGGTVTPPVSMTDRFCDTSFQAVGSYVRTSAKPFIMHIRTDMSEGGANDMASVGFCFRWQQNPQ